MQEHLRILLVSFKPLALVLASLTLANINALLTFIGLSLSIIYGIRKFYLLEKNNKIKKEIKDEEN